MSDESFVWILLAVIMLSQAAGVIPAAMEKSKIRFVAWGLLATLPLLIVYFIYRAWNSA